MVQPDSPSNSAIADSLTFIQDQLQSLGFWVQPLEAADLQNDVLLNLRRLLSLSVWAQKDPNVAYCLDVMGYDLVVDWALGSFREKLVVTARRERAGGVVSISPRQAGLFDDRDPQRKASSVEDHPPRKAPAA